MKKFRPLLLGAILAVALTWPFTAKLSSFHRDGTDYALDGWILWYNQMSLSTGRIFHQESYFTTTQMRPMPDSLAFSENMFVPSLLFSPIYRIARPFALSVNVFILLILILNFISGFHAIDYFVRNPAASMLGGAIYAFNPLVFSHFPDQFHLLNLYFIPPLFVFGYQYLKDPRAKNAAFFSLFFTLNALSSMYFQAFAIVLFPLFALPFFAGGLLRKDKAYFKRLCLNGLVFLAFVPMLLYFDLPYFKFSREEGVVRTLELNRFYSARGIDWICSTPENLLYGKFVKRLEKSGRSNAFHANEHTLFLNLFPTLLFGLGIYGLTKKLKKKKGKTEIPLENKFAAWGFCAVLGGAFALAWGPYFLGWNRDYGTVKLPFYYLFTFTHLLDGTRVPTRFEFPFYLPFSIFAAYGAGYLFEKKKNLRMVLFALLLLGIGAENITLKKYDDTSVILQQLTGANDFKFLKGRLTFHLPTFYENKPGYFGYVRESNYLDWNTQTGESMVNGYSGYFAPDWILLVLRLKKLDPEAVRELKALQVEEVVIHKNLFAPGTWPLWEASHNRIIQSAKTYEDPDTIVLDMNKLSAFPGSCGTKKIAQESFRLFSIDGEPAYFTTKLKNPQNCYLVSRGERRYFPIAISAGGIKVRANLVLPIILPPFQETQVTGYLLPPKNTANPIPDFTMIH